uniref:DNA topoisomerase n=1 Tax=viral metagenome TaxID=1070528 RepID=A0A6C0AWB9_9ZZZZ|tara:strand:+ start:22005 stop:24242 length:2238 start_codon:yes stop_codon:yes gene_type:complete
MVKNNTLIIVESNGKCKKIEKYTGHKCIASFGHVYALKPSLDWFNPNKIEPEYIICKGKEKIISKLKQEAKKASRVIIASDLDREGEAIAANLMDLLKLNVKKTDRITFNEISERALKEAIDNPGKLNQNLYDSQKARAIIDLLFGFTVSPFLSKHLNTFALSAGRCQTPALRICMERQQEQKVGEKSLIISASAKSVPKITHIKPRVTSPEKWLQNLIPQKFVVKDISTRDKKEKPPPPFITSTLQQTAYAKHNFSPKHTMQLAQKLYEGGYITYMRTDSVTLSSQFQNQAEEWIIKEFGDKYFQKRQYSKGNKRTQDAHEAIRPINLLSQNPSDSQQSKLYNLIKLRSIGSQMAEAVYSESKFTLETSRTKTVKDIWESIFRKLIFDGYTKLKGASEGSSETAPPKLKKGDELNILQVTVKEHAKTPPAPYNPASLVKTLEKSGIGRPSTYSTIIDRIQDKGYVVLGTNIVLDAELNSWELSKGKIKESKYTQKIGGQSNVFMVTPLGERVCEFFKNSTIESIVSVDFTSKMENDLDSIANGNMKWKDLVKKFDKELTSKIKKQPKPEKTSNKTRNWIKVLDTDSSGNNIGIVKSLYGYSIAKEIDGKLTYAPMPPKTSPEQMLLQDANKMLSLPIKITDKIELKLGQYGWYANDGTRNVGLGNEKEFPSKKEILDAFDKKPTSNIIKKIDDKWSLRKKNDSHYLMYILGNGKKPLFYPVSDISGQWNTKRAEEIRKKYINKS